MSTEFILSLDDLTSLQSHQNPYLSQPEKGLALLTTLVGRPPQQLDDAAAQPLAVLRRLIEEDYLRLGDGYPETAKIYRELKALADALEDLVLFPTLANRTTIGIGGGFSAGKSRFVNSLLGNSYLPEALEPSTAIPTFVLKGEHSIVGVNAFSQQVELDTDALSAISHDFHQQYRERFNIDVGFAHVLRYLLLRSPDFPWSNLALLDTPGFNRSDSNHNTLSDEKLAMAQLSNADHVLWLVKAGNGDLRADDTDFLRQIKLRNPIFFVISQADLLLPSDLAAVIDKVRKTVEAAGLACAGVGAWAAPVHEARGSTLAGDDVQAWLKTLNAQVKYTDKRRRCAFLLEQHLLHNTTQLADNRELLSELNQLQVLAENTSEEQKQAIEAQIKRLKSEQVSFNQRMSAVQQLNKAMASAIAELLGPVVEDAAPAAMHEIHRSFKTHEAPGHWLSSKTYEFEISACRPDLKRLCLHFKPSNATLHLPFSQIKEVWKCDPMAIPIGQKLQARVLEANSKNLSLAFSLNRI